MFIDVGDWTEGVAQAGGCAAANGWPGVLGRIEVVLFTGVEGAVEGLGIVIQQAFIPQHAAAMPHALFVADPVAALLDVVKLLYYPFTPL